MRNTFVMFAALALFFLPVTAGGQTNGNGWELTKLAAVTGKGVLGSGLGGTAVFERDSATHTFEISGDDDQGWMAYDVKLGVVNLAITAGLLNNTPWFGPRVSVTPVKGLVLMTWPGVSVGRRFGEPDWALNWGIKSGFVFYTLGPVTASYAVLKFEEGDVQHIPGLAITRRINSNYQLLVGADYDFTKVEPLYRIEVSWKPRGF